MSPANGQWWSTVWVSAIAHAFGEPEELESGARLARRLRLDRPEVAPGSVILRDPEEGWVAQLGVTQLDGDQWDTVVDALTSDPRTAAAVITGELPVDLHGRAVGLGCSLVPERRDIGIDCTCPDWREPCRHVGALVAVVSGMVEADPWLLTMLRGRTRDEIVQSVRSRRVGGLGIESEDTDTTRGIDLGVPVEAAFGREPHPLPAPLAGLRQPGRPVEFPAPPVDAGVEIEDLNRLVADAASRAFRLLAGDIGADALLIDPDEDQARIELSDLGRDP